MSSSQFSPCWDFRYVPRSISVHGHESKDLSPPHLQAVLESGGAPLALHTSPDLVSLTLWSPLTLQPFNPSSRNSEKPADCVRPTPRQPARGTGLESMLNHLKC